MTATFRTDWIEVDPYLNPHGNRVDVSFHGENLKAARAKARKMSARVGSAYVIKSVDGVDVGQIGYTDGRAETREFTGG